MSGLIAARGRKWIFRLHRKRLRLGFLRPDPDTVFGAIFIVEMLALIASPMTPHIADELWEMLGKTGPIYKMDWPEYDETIAAEEEFTLVVQVNGKVRDRITVPADSSDETIKMLALASTQVTVLLTENKQKKKVIVVPKKLVNVVIG